MSRLTADHLAEQLTTSADQAFRKTATFEVIATVTEMLFLKLAADQPSFYQIRDPEPMRTIAVSPDPGRQLHRLLGEVALDNPRTVGVSADNLRVEWKLPPAQIARFAESLDRISLRAENLEFSDTVGTAYDRFLAHIMNMTGKIGSSISTPDSVADLMVRIIAPEAGESVCDPFAGLAGFLTLTHDYVREIGGNVATVDLFGQELSSEVWLLAKLNLLLHGIYNCELLEGDTLADPALKSSEGRLKDFDVILTHAPFSMSYDRAQIRYQGRMRYGWPSQHGRADLLTVQHVLATLADGGRGIVLVPFGVLFRSGPEAEIRRGMVQDHRIDAVIGLGANILHDIGIPACILILRGPGRSRFEPPDDVLFINAEPELTRSRGINRFGPEAIEKVATVLRYRADLPGFSRKVTAAEIASNEFNLSVRHYTDQDLQPEAPADAIAIISGGVPRSEVSAAAGQFAAFGIDPTSLFDQENTRHLSEENSGYLYFFEEGYKATANEIINLSVRRVDTFVSLCQDWWDLVRGQFTSLAAAGQLLSSRPQLMASFTTELQPDGILDEYQLRGAFAAWWSAWHDDFKVLEHYGFPAAVDRWLAAGGAARARNFLGNPADTMLEILGADLVARARGLVIMEQRKLVDIYLSWGERYGASLLQLEADAQDARGRLEDRLRELGYVDPWGP